MALTPLTAPEFKTWLASHTASFPGANVLAAGLTLMGEIRNGTYDGQIAVAQTFNNRARAKSRAIADICLQFEQYSCWWPIGGKDNNVYLMGVTTAIVEAINAGKIDFMQYPLLNQMMYLARGVVLDYLPDHTKGSTHYYVEGTPEPTWAKGKTPAVIIGPHRFYNNIAW